MPQVQSQTSTPTLPVTGAKCRKFGGIIEAWLEGSWLEGLHLVPISSSFPDSETIAHWVSRKGNSHLLGPDSSHFISQIFKMSKHQFQIHSFSLAECNSLMTCDLLLLFLLGLVKVKWNDDVCVCTCIHVCMYSTPEALLVGTPEASCQWKS